MLKLIYLIPTPPVDYSLFDKPGMKKTVKEQNNTQRKTYKLNNPRSIVNT